MHVFKFVFWNIIASGALLSVGGGMDEASYIPRFYLTFGIMCLLAFTLIIKVVLGTIYLFIYRCKSDQYQKDNISTNKYREEEENGISIKDNFERVKQSMYKEIQ